MVGEWVGGCVGGCVAWLGPPPPTFHCLAMRVSEETLNCGWLGKGGWIKCETESTATPSKQRKLKTPSAKKHTHKVVKNTNYNTKCKEIIKANTKRKKQ